MIPRSHSPTTTFQSTYLETIALIRDKPVASFSLLLPTTLEVDVSDSCSPFSGLGQFKCVYLIKCDGFSILTVNYTALECKWDNVMHCPCLPVCNNIEPYRGLVAQWPWASGMVDPGQDFSAGLKEQKDLQLFAFFPVQRKI